ncbi:MAG: recombination protein RecR [Elusimicrobia bacterium]|nr:recombination protein RecR [Elusimicrobiota bacterium]
MNGTGAWDRLVSALLGMPGVGPKMAERAALHLIRRRDAGDALLLALADARARMRRCPLCGDFVEGAPLEAADAAGLPEADGPCNRCRDPHRDDRLLCVVEDVGDLAALERSRAFGGKYHVLGGVLSALDGVGPEELRIEALLGRVAGGTTDEVILATNPSVEGETTAAYLADLLKNRGVRVTRLASGLPSGSVIQYADEHTLAQALSGRRAVPA